jgi:hypothetical protein
MTTPAFAYESERNPVGNSPALPRDSTPNTAPCPSPPASSSPGQSHPPAKTRDENPPHRTTTGQQAHKPMPCNPRGGVAGSQEASSLQRAYEVSCRARVPLTLRHTNRWVLLNCPKTISLPPVPTAAATQTPGIPPPSPATNPKSAADSAAWRLQSAAESTPLKYGPATVDTRTTRLPPAPALESHPRNEPVSREHHRPDNRSSTRADQ